MILLKFYDTFIDFGNKKFEKKLLRSTLQRPIMKKKGWQDSYHLTFYKSSFCLIFN